MGNKIWKISKWFLCKLPVLVHRVQFSVNSVPGVDCNCNQTTNSAFPVFPFQQSEQAEKPDGLSNNQEVLLHHLIIDEVKFYNIEKTAREQAASQEWQAEKKFSFTASNTYIAIFLGHFCPR